ncbi:hypothetical protein MTER_06320 [Mycolicibacter terrae]|uniref:Uncharacterized protein n=2 Tax=Mycolicibacter terrae TaxID=1788 RepID=A0AAD1MG01_9MYCO|nr:hypothetical protein [Mycolicibacter terrae]BBX21221.1 hypothetical protein MTER_06320 [Mycolicibacter terrae]SNV91029.1 Uncharacterised protein [Mycolicibacter terrae]
MVRSRMEVWADDPAGAVLWAGGLICDLAMAGWDVVVRLPVPSDGRSLEILGASVCGHEEQYVPHESAGPLVTLSDASPDPDREREALSYLCGPVGSDRLSFADNGFRHRLSVGARAFKAHALRASGLPGEVATTELFWPAMPLPFSVEGSSDGRTLDDATTPRTHPKPAVRRR